MNGYYYISDNVNEGAFESLDSIMSSTFEMNFDERDMEYDGIPVISDGHNARGYCSEQPVMVVAATGSGKTRRLIIQYLISCILSGASFIANDPKGELYKHVSELLKDKGYKVMTFNCRDTALGDRYNLCEYPARLYKSGNKSKATDEFQALFDALMMDVKSERDLFWHTTSAQYLTGLAMLACELMPTEMITINNIFNLHLQGNKRFGGNTYLKEYLDMNTHQPYYNLIYPYITAPNETRGSLDAVLTSAISKFCRNEMIIDQTTNSTFSIMDIVEKKTALFIISRDESTVYNSFISAMVNQIYQAVIDIAEEKYNGRLKRHLAIILDEFGNLTPISDINEKITVSRSRNIGWCLGCQSLDQLKSKYGEDIAKIIIGNCNLAYMYSNDIALLKMISELCGKTTDEYTHESRPLLSVEQLRHFDKNAGQTLFLLERKLPFIGFLPDISKYSVVRVSTPKYKRRVIQVLEQFDFTSIVREKKKEKIRTELEESAKAASNYISLDNHENRACNYPTTLEWIKAQRDSLAEEYGDVDIPNYIVAIQSYGNSRETVARVISIVAQVSFSAAYEILSELPAKVGVDSKEEANNLILLISQAGGKAILEE